MGQPEQCQPGALAHVILVPASRMRNFPSCILTPAGGPPVRFCPDLCLGWAQVPRGWGLCPLLMPPQWSVYWGVQGFPQCPFPSVMMLWSNSWASGGAALRIPVGLQGTRGRNSPPPPTPQEEQPGTWGSGLDLHCHCPLPPRSGWPEF